MPTCFVHGTPVEKHLAQLRPTSTSNTSIYAPASGIRGIVRIIVVANSHTSSVTYRIFNDADGTTWTEDTMLFYDVTIAANTTEVISFRDSGLIIEYGGSLAVRTSDADELNFTVYGEEVTL